MAKISTEPTSAELAQNATGYNQQIRLKGTQCEHIQSTYKAIDSPAWISEIDVHFHQKALLGRNKSTLN